MAGLLLVSLLPVVGAAVSPDVMRPTSLPVAIVPLAALKAPPLALLIAPPAQAIPRESGLLALVGTGLIGLGAIVRKSTTDGR